MKIQFLVFMSCLLLAASSSRAQNNTAYKNVAILLFDNVQIIDYTGPYEIFGYGFNVFTVSSSKTIETNMGMKVTPSYDLEHCPPADIIVLPGGSGVRSCSSQPKVIQWIQEKSKKAQVVMSVCNGAFFLARAGLLDGMEATTTAGGIDSLQQLVPSAHIVRNKRFVDNGKIVTTAGLSSGIDGSLHVVSKLLGVATANLFARWLEYNWKPESKYAAASLADCNISKLFNAYFIDELKGVPLKYQGDTEDWQGEVLIHSDKSITTLTGSLNDIIISRQKWRLKQIDKSSSESEWNFKGKDLHVWNGSSKISGTSKKGEYKIWMPISKHV